MTKIVCVLLQRKDLSVPWGFRLTGGIETSRPLVVYKVSPGTIASQQLIPGDVLLAIQDHDARAMSLDVATALIRSATLTLELTIHKLPTSLEPLLQPKLSNAASNDWGHRIYPATSTINTSSNYMPTSIWGDTPSKQSNEISGGVTPPVMSGPPMPPPMPGPGGAPPPPPPPPPPGPSMPSIRLKSELPDAGSRGSRLGPPPAIQAAMVGKDKKPFTYTPGGLDLSEIRSPRMHRRICRNAVAEGVTPAPPPTASAPPPPRVMAPPQIAVPVLPPPPPPAPPMPSKSHIAPRNEAPVPKPSETQNKQASGNMTPPIYSHTNGQANRQVVTNAEPSSPVSTIRVTPKEIEKPAYVQTHEDSSSVVQTSRKPPTTVYIPATSANTTAQVGQIYVAPVHPKAGNNHPTSSQSGSLYIPPISPPAVQQVPHSPSPGSPIQVNLNKAPMPWMNSQGRQQNTGMWSSPPPTANSAPAASKTRIIPIQVEGRDEPVNVQPGSNSNRAHTRVVPIQMDGSASPSSQVESRKPMATNHQVRYVPPQMDQAPSSPSPQVQMGWSSGPSSPSTVAPVQSRSFRVLQRITSSDEDLGPSTPQSPVIAQVAPPNQSQMGNAQQQMRKLHLTSEDRQLMDRFRAQDDFHEFADDQGYGLQLYRGGNIPSRVFRLLDQSVDEDTFLHSEADPRYRGPAIPSRAFRMLQTMTEGAPSAMGHAVPVSSGPGSQPSRPEVPIRGMRSDNGAQQAYVPASEQAAQPEPRKYMGGCIPSRSFRMLQAMTSPEDCETSEVPPEAMYYPPPSPSPSPYSWYYPPEGSTGDPVWDSYIYAYVANYGHYPPGYYYPSPTYESDEYSGYSSTEEMTYYGNPAQAPSTQPATPGSAAVEGDASSSEGDQDEDDSDTEVEDSDHECNMNRSSNGLQAIKSLPDIHANGQLELAEDDEDDSDSEGTNDDENRLGAKQLSIIYEESEHSDAESVRRQQRLAATTPALTETEEESSDSEQLRNTNTHERCKQQNEMEESETESEQESDTSDTEAEEQCDENKCTDKFSECESKRLSEYHDSESEVEANSVSDDESNKGLSIEAQADISDEESSSDEKCGKLQTSSTVVEMKSNDSPVSCDSDDAPEATVTVRLPLRLKFSRNSSTEAVTTVIVGDSEQVPLCPRQTESSSATAKVEEWMQRGEKDGKVNDGDSEVSVCLSLPLRRNPPPPAEGEDSHWEDDSSSTSIQTVRPRCASMASITLPNDENASPVNSGSPKGPEQEPTELEKQPKVNTREKRTGEKKPKRPVRRSSTEDDSGVTDMSRQISDSESEELLACQRVATHSRLYKLLQDACEDDEIEVEDVDKAKSQALARRELLRLPLRSDLRAATEHDSSSLSSSGITSPASPTVAARLVRELAKELSRRKGKRQRPARLQAAAMRIMREEENDPYDTTTGSSASSDSGGARPSPLQAAPSNLHPPYFAPYPPPPPHLLTAYGPNYYDYLDYYNSWGAIDPREYAMVPARAFRVLSNPSASPLDAPYAKCPRIAGQLPSTPSIPPPSSCHDPTLAS